MDWDDFRYVQAVARAGSVRGAAAELGVNASTVVRHLDQLEERLGTRLFARERHGMSITAAGSEVVAVLDRVADDLAGVERRLRGRRSALAGVVRVAVATDLAEALLLPQVAEFALRHPEIGLALLPAADLQSLQRGQVDAALWITDAPPQDLIGRRCGAVAFAVYGTPAHAGVRAGAHVADSAPQRVSPGDGGRWIALDAGPLLRGVCAELKSRHAPQLPEGLSCTDPLLMRSALQAGLGVGVLPCYLGDAAPGLIRLDTAPPLRAGELWLLSATPSRGVARVQAVLEYLQEIAAAFRTRLEAPEH